MNESLQCSEKQLCNSSFTPNITNLCDRDSSVGIATRCGMDGTGIEFRWLARFSVPVQTGPGAHPVSYTMGTGSFTGGKAAGEWYGPPTPNFSAEALNRVELYLYLP